MFYIVNIYIYILYQEQVTEHVVYCSDVEKPRDPNKY